MKKILFVCHGNICRSPMAEFVFKMLVTEHNLSCKYDCDSRATTREEIGNGIYPAAKRELFRRGVKIGEHTADQLLCGCGFGFRRESTQQFLRGDSVVAIQPAETFFISQTKGQ